MEHEPQSYEHLMAEGHKALTARRVEDAEGFFMQAEGVTTKGTEESIRASQMIALCESMLGHHEDALNLLSGLEEQAIRMDDDQLRSDVLRDLVLAIHRDPNGDLPYAHTKLDEALDLNHDENNQWALTGIRGRLLMKEAKPEEALEAHQHADEGWDTMRQEGKETNDQWQFNNLLPYYEAAKTNGNHELATTLRDRIEIDTTRYTDQHREKLEEIDAKF